MTGRKLHRQLLPPCVFLLVLALASIIYDNAIVNTRPKRKTSVSSSLPILQVSNEDLQRESRPRFVLHIGPHKTGTSSLQCQLNTLKSFLGQNSTVDYIGRIYGDCLPKEDVRTFRNSIVDTRRLVSCLDRHEIDGYRCNETKDWNHFVQILLRLAEKHQSVILSDEAFARLRVSPSNMKLLHSTLTSVFDVRLIVVYRRFWEWILSIHNEDFKPLARRHRYSVWPDQGGLPLQTFPDFYRRLRNSSSLNSEGIPVDTRYFFTAYRQGKHPAEYLRDLFREHFDDIIMLNVHDELYDSLLELFLNKSFPEYTFPFEDIGRILQSQPESAKKNPSINLNFDIMAVAAYEKGLISHPSAYSRRQVSDLVKKRWHELYEGKEPDSCMTCLSNAEEIELFEYSARLDERILAGSPSAKEKETVWHPIESTPTPNLRFCNVNTGVLLDDPSWKAFFRSLN